MPEKNNLKCKSFESAIDLGLFYGILYFLVPQTVREELCKRGTRKIPWWKEGNNSKEAVGTGFRYFGEFLERFEEKYGSDIRIFRTAALALGYLSEFLTAEMFVGTQKEDFLKQLENRAEDDIYLNGALYLLSEDSEKKKSILESLSGKSYQKTEEAVFVLSLFEDKEEGYGTMRSQLTKLFEKERTASAIHDAGIFFWLYKQYGPVIKSCRKRESTALRALVKLSETYAKKGSQPFETLLRAGYSEEEIVYLNLFLAYNGYSIKTDGIMCEKLAVEFFVTFLNLDKNLDENILFELQSLYIRYENFAVRYEGNKGIWEASKEQLHPVSPTTVLWMVKNIDKKFDYYFDVFDSRWKILAENLKDEKYLDLFTAQMLRQENMNKETVQVWFEKYKELTGRDYMQEFNKYFELRQEIFALLVKIGVIIPADFFEEHLHDSAEGEYNSCLSTLHHYVDDIPTKEAFEFWKYFFGKYSVLEASKIFRTYNSFHTQFYLNAHTGPCWNIQKDFLSTEENQMLFEWVEDSVFMKDPKNYPEFVKNALKNKFVQSIYPKEVLCECIKTLEEKKLIGYWGIKEIKRQLYSPEDFAADQAREAEKERLKKEAEKQQQEKQWKEELKESFDGSFTSLKKWACDYWGQSKKEKIKLIETLLKEVVQNGDQSITNKEYRAFFELYVEIISLDAIPKEKMDVLALEMMKKEIVYVKSE